MTNLRNNVSSPLFTAYQQKLASGLNPDEGQQRVVKALAHLQSLLAATQIQQPRLLRFFQQRNKAELRGIYIWGAVGRGKSMLMDLFFQTTPLEARRRVHFHAFMLDVHARIHQARQAGIEENPVEAVAEDIAREVRLLCLDELQVSDVADAMILEKLFTTLLNEGVTVVFTSNRPPEELYRGGLQRDRFLRFVALLRERMDIVELASPEDYRLKQIRALKKVYCVGADCAAFLEQTFAALTGGQAPHPAQFEYQGRVLELPRTYGSVAFCTFAELCERPLGANDYLHIAEKFHTLLMAGIPLLTPEKRNEAKRLVTLIDALYENKVVLICSAAALPEKLYPEGDGSFEFRRTASRLAEMQSEGYLKR
jgi:cell division protein ZapE